MKQISLTILVVLLLTGIASAATSSGSTSEGTQVSIDMLNQNPDPARTGEIVDVRFSIGNYGLETAQGVTISMELEYPFFPVEGEEYQQYITSLKPFADNNEEIVVKFKVMVDKDASDGTHEIIIKSSENENTITKEFDFGIEIQGKEYAQIITIDKSQIQLGTEESLEFVITNTGGTALQNMVFSWTERTGTVLPVYSDNNKYIKFLGVGESQTVKYNVMADVNSVPGLYQLDLSLKFTSSNTAEQ